jgi:hypothetical protein
MAPFFASKAPDADPDPAFDFDADPNYPFFHSDADTGSIFSK